MPYLLIVLTVLLRFFPHPFGLTPVGALGLFAGAYCPPKIAWAVPLLALAVGDLMNGGYHLLVMVFVYVGFLGGPLLGRWLLSKRRNPGNLVIAVLGGASIFFLVSNFGMWLADPGDLYAPTLTGLLNCYINGLPYFRIMLIGDLVYSAILFGAAEAFNRYRHVLSPAHRD